MIYFKNMTVNATTDEKNKNRVSSAEKNSDNIIFLEIISPDRKIIF